MLIRFGVENHRSIKTYQQLLLTASSAREHQETVVDIPAQRLQLLPIVAVYGANASGKSNLLGALGFFLSAIQNSHNSKDLTTTPFHPFLLDADSRSKPSKYDADVLLDGVRFHYGFRLNGKKILEEWLYAFPGGKTRNVRQMWFHRNSDLKDPFHFGKALRGENKTIAKLVRPNSLFLSSAAQNAHPQLSKLFQYFSQRIVRISNDTMLLERKLGSYFESNSELREKTISFLKNADIGISGFRFEKKPVPELQKKMLQDLHEALRKHIDELPRMDDDEVINEGSLEHIGFDGKTYQIDFDGESSGTRSLLSFLGPLFKAFQEGGVLLFDELSNTLHPLVSRELLRLISSPKTNPGRAQLLFTTHDTNLLNGGILRRDQIWFAEKDRTGATHIYPLSDIKVKPTDNLERGYLQGRFGAIPFLSGIEEVVVEAPAT